MTKKTFNNIKKDLTIEELYDYAEIGYNFLQETENRRTSQLSRRGQL